MSKMDRKVKEEYKNKNKVVNFMNGISYNVNPILTLKMVTASSIFGEPQYYRDGEFAPKTARDGIFTAYRYGEISKDIIFDDMEGKKTSEIMEDVIDKALDYDFLETLKWAETLRYEYNMRLNPQIIMVRAAKHPKRKEFTKQNPKLFDNINQKVMSRADEPASQLTYWLYRNKSKNSIPSILKRGWAKRLSNATKYELYKYKNKGIGIIDTVRICHANSEYIDELMQTGNLTVEEKTWESLRSQNFTWKEILKEINLGHMALLRNLRGIFSEIDDKDFCIEIMDKLKKGVKNGKQFPFRYFSAMKAIQNFDINHKALILNTLEECIDISLQNMPRLKGKTMCLSDNSGSAWCTFQSEYGTMTIAEIDNLSSVITAALSDEGYVGKFGDKLKNFSILKRNGILSTAEKISLDKGKDVGLNTENGIWLFFDEAIKKKNNWDNIFIYSDQQAGHGGLYGTDSSKYKEYSIHNGRYIDVYKLIKKYRKEVNPKVNIYSVQTAGYSNVVVPENCYRTSILYGWTGNEIVYADIINKLWDECEKNN